MKTRDEVQIVASTLTEATHKLCIKLAACLDGKALPIPERYRDYYYPIGCRIALTNNKVLGEVPEIEVKIIAHKPTHIKVRGIYPVSKHHGAFTPLQAPLAVCTASRMKEVIHIARQIKGKFMATFLPTFENCLLDMRATERMREMAEAEAYLIRSVSGLKPGGNPLVVSGGDITFICNGGSIEVKAEIPVDLAAQFARLYREHKANEERKNG